MRHPFRLASVLVLVLAVALLPATLRGQSPAAGDTAVVAPGPQYAASGLKEVVFGSDYRDLWTTPLRVPVLDLRGFAGGLKPTRRGGGLQTRSVRFRGADGREYAFRSVNKYPHLTDEPALANTVVGDVIQDQVSSLHPGAPLAIPTLLDAVGVPHVTPRLVVMPDDPLLGEFREEFAGMLGTIEERPDERDGDGSNFGGYPRIIGTDRLLERIEDSPEDRIDARAYLTARLMDLLLGDWDRHEDQWRWGQEDRGGVRYWVAIPRDRDYAFVDYDGLLMKLGRSFAPNAVRFGPKYEHVLGLTLNSRVLDRRLLGGLDRAAWDSVAASIQRRLTDEVIADGVSRMPPELARQSAAKLAAILRARRDQLPSAVEQYYDRMSTEVDVYGTDEEDLALVDRIADRTVRVRLYELDGDEAKGEAYLDRTFHAGDTREIRIYLQGDDDRALVRGDVRESLMVRVIGGGGDDLFADSSVVRGGSGETAFYDSRGDNEFDSGPETVVDTREYEPPPRTLDLSGESYRDWGDLRTFRPIIGYQSADGPVIGFGPTFTRFGFRREPYRYMLAGRAMVGLASGAIGLEVNGDFRRGETRNGVSVRALATQLDPIHFYGFGNDTDAEEPGRAFVVRQNRVIATGLMYYGLPGGRIGVGPVVKFTRTQIPAGSPFEAAHEGGRGFGQLGGRADLQLDWRDAVLYPRSGGTLQAGGAAYPAVWDAPGLFGEAHATATTYLTPGIPLSPTFALRAGGKRVWGEFPVHEAAFLGGSNTVRGYAFNRFAGDALLFGNVEARLPLGEVKHLVRGDLGVLGMLDAGRVYHDGESPGGWHTAAGGGLWFRFRIRDALVAASALYAQAEEDGRLYLKFGAPF